MTTVIKALHVFGSWYGTGYKAKNYPSEMNMTGEKLKILHLEDLPSDAEQINRVLKKGGIEFESLVVDTRALFIQGVKDFAPHVIIADHSLPAFDSFEALKILREMDARIPFMLVTGTVSEEFAVDAMKQGAWDYILKDRIQRLPAAVLSAIEKYRLESERQKYLEEVIASEALFKEAESLAHFGSWESDLPNGTTKWSEETYRILGYEPGEIEASLENFINCIHPGDRAETKGLIDNAIAHLNFLKLHFRIKLRDESVKYIRSELAIRRNTKLEAVHITGFNLDITETRQAEAEIKALNESLEKKVAERTAQLEDANKELESFSYSVSHDLRAPLRIINAFAELIMKNYAASLNEEGQALLQQIATNAVRMNRLIDDLMSFSHAGRTTLNMSHVNMNNTVKSAIETVKQDYAKHIAEIEIADLKPCVCDPQLIKQVWLNLIANAIKYSSKKEKPFVEIGSKEDNGRVVYYVKDNGAGFDQKYAGKLFGVFQRLHKDSEFEGTGVGLALVQRIVSRHGGKIWGEGKVNDGATFYFTLPC